jgi:hypothetical protein
VLKDAARLLPRPSRRPFLRNATGLGALALLTGCDIVDARSAVRALRIVSDFNDWVQARPFNPNRLAETYSEGAITRPFPFRRKAAPCSVPSLAPSAAADHGA